MQLHLLPPRLLRRLDQDVKRLPQMLLVRLRTPAHHPNDIPPAHHAARQHDLPPRINHLIDILRDRVPENLLVDPRAPVHGPRPHPQDRHRERRPADDREQVRAVAHPRGELLAEPDVVREVGAHALHAVGADDEPDLQAAEAPAERDLPVAVVGHEAALAVHVAQVGGRDGEGVDEVGALFDVEEGGVEVGEEPFVHVGVKGVEGGKAGGVVLVFREDQGDAGVGGVDMDPDGGVVSDDGGDFGEVVYGAGGGCACGC